MSIVQQFESAVQTHGDAKGMLVRGRHKYQPTVRMLVRRMVEGAEIACGQRAAPGAIERLRIDKVTLVPTYKVIDCDLWSDEEGFEEAIAATGVTGICGSGIIEALGEMYLAGILKADGIIDGKLATRNDLIQPDGSTFS